MKISTTILGSVRLLGFVIIAALAAAGCMRQVIPDDLYDQVDTSIEFPELRANAEQMRGKVVALGGEVISARATRDGTQLEVLELPLDQSDRPISDRGSSRGRFLVMDRELDTAVVQNGRRITIVGEVTGSKTLPLDETEYTYPVINSRFMQLWSPRPARGGYGFYDPSPYGYGPVYSPFYPYGYYGFYGRDVIIIPDHRARGGGSSERRFKD